MKTLRGNPSNISQSIIGRVTRTNGRIAFDKSRILISDDAKKLPYGYLALLTSRSMDDSSLSDNTTCVAGIPDTDIESLNEGDIVLIRPGGIVNRLWDAKSKDNIIMVTNTCNCRCIMCPQPSCKDPDDILAVNKRVLQLVDSDVCSIGFTGGEPTLRLEDLCELLDICKRRFPDAAINLLTNGRRYSDINVARAVALVDHPNLTHCVSLDADLSDIHDRIMGVRGSFEEAISGLHNLALLRQCVELRFVIQRDNYQRLPGLAEFIYRNLPFVAHIALMGMETTGLAHSNIEDIWIDPGDYADQLKDAVHHLHQRDLNVSIYNLPLCLLPRELWDFAKDSISDWKKTFLPQCDSCSVRKECPGVFATSKKHSTGISPID